MTADARPLLRFMPWLLASAVAHAVLLLQWPASDSNNIDDTVAAGQAGALQIQLLHNIAAATQPASSTHPTAVAATRAVTAAPTAAPQPRTAAAIRTVAAQLNAATDNAAPSAATAAAMISSASSATAESPHPVSAVAQEDSATDNASWTELMALLHQAIDRNKRYPQSALRMGREGSARIDFRLGPDGRIEDLNIGNSSGVRALDVAAYRAVQGIAPFPEANRYLDRAKRFQVDVVFRIN